jgi:hypothetical protein
LTLPSTGFYRGRLDCRTSRPLTWTLPPSASAPARPPGRRSCPGRASSAFLPRGSGSTSRDPAASACRPCGSRCGPPSAAYRQRGGGTRARLRPDGTRVGVLEGPSVSEAHQAGGQGLAVGALLCAPKATGLGPELGEVDPRFARHPKLVVVDALVGRRTPIRVRGRFTCKRAVFRVAGPGFEPGTP